MGNSYGNIRSPRMCFNGAKFWQLGWYPNHRISLNPARDGPWRGSLVGFVDVASVPANDPNTVVLVQVADLYLLQNRKISFNSDSVGHGNQVTVARAPSLSGKSDLLEGLRPSVPIITVDVTLDGSVRTLVIEICERIIADIITYELSIHLVDQASACGTTLPPYLVPVSPPPSPNPMPLPTPQPTLPPSSAPVSRPPSPNPTPLSTPMPTLPPSPAPVSPPPSSNPTPLSTPQPTLPPSLRCQLVAFQVA